MENDPFAVSLYAQDIFEYYKEREVSLSVIYLISYFNPFEFDLKASNM